VIGVLYYFGGEGIHAFSYCMLIGVVVGTYSTVFIAAPVLLWLTDRHEAKLASKSA
jgi:SecD/SecF fusion protein